jgi:hypothetical protein
VRNPGGAEVRSALIVAVALLLVLVVSAAVAEPYVSVWADDSAKLSGTSSWYGNEGLIVTPTAAMPGTAGATVQYHRIQRDSEDVNVWGANFGVTDWLEAGGTQIDIEGDGSKTVGNLKLKVPAASLLKNPAFPDVAVGCFDVTDEINRAYYLVLSKTVALEQSGYLPRINLHLGFADNKANDGAMDGVFGGLEFNVMKFGLIQAEWDADAFNADLRINAGDHFSLDVGILDSDLGYGASYRSSF